MLEILDFSAGRIHTADVRGADERIRALVLKQCKLKKSDYWTPNVPSVHVHCLPSMPVWPDVWNGSDRHVISRSLHVPFTAETYESLLPIVASHEPKLGVRVEILWPQHPVFYFEHPLRSIYERVYDGFSIAFSPRYRGRLEENAEQIRLVFGTLTKLWDLDGILEHDGNRSFFNINRPTKAIGSVHCRNNKTPAWPDYMSWFKIEDFNQASQIAKDSVKTLIECLGKPRLIVVRIESFVEEAGQCAEFCRSLAPAWYTNFWKDKKKFDPFTPPKEFNGTVVYPIAWNSFRANEVDMEDFTDIYTAVEHTPEGTNLMLATNHDDKWLQDVVTKAGYAEHFELLGDDAKFADVKSLVSKINATKPTWQVEKAMFPSVKLDANATLESAYEQAIRTFEVAGLYVHRHEAFATLESVGKMFSCHEDGRNDSFIVHAGPWTDADTEVVRNYAKSLMQIDGLFQCTGVKVLATHPLPPRLFNFE